MANLIRLTLNNFRNYEYLNWLPHSQKIVLYGENGCGKTNLLEALSLLVPGKGLRRSRLEELPRLNSHGGWGVIGQFAQEEEPVEIAIGCIEQNRKQFLINGAPVRAQSEINQYLSAIWLTPQMDRLFLEGASGRRRFLDRLIISTETYHIREVAAYEKNLSHRNRLLSQNVYDESWLSAIEESMARHAVAISAARLTFIDQINEIQVIEGKFPEAFIQLQCPIAERLKHEPALMVEDFLRQQWKQNRIKDQAVGATTIGVHRSDVLFSDRKTQIPASLASTGQQKALLVGIILKLTELNQIRHTHQPMILLDEPLVHLDNIHRKTLLQTLKKLDTLTILTGTDKDPFSDWSGVGEFVQIYDGKLK